MKHFTKSTYLLLASHILAVAPLYTAQYPPLAPWLRQEIQQLIDNKTEYKYNYKTWSSVFEHSLARTLIHYNQQNIPWMQQDFWQDAGQKEKLIEDIGTQTNHLYYPSDLIPLPEDKFSHEALTEGETPVAHNVYNCYWNSIQRRKGHVKLEEAYDWLKLIFTQAYQVNWDALPYTRRQLTPWSAIITKKRIITDQLPKDPNHSYLYDILTQHTLPYLIGDTPVTLTHTKALLKELWQQSGANPYAPVHYTDPATGQQVRQTPILFLASPNFAKLLKKPLADEPPCRTNLHKLFTDKRKKENDKVVERITRIITHNLGVGVYDPIEAASTYIRNYYTADLMRFHFNYQEFTLSKAQIAQTPIVIANTRYTTLGLPDDLAKIIGAYTGLALPAIIINAQDSHGHTALDYHPLEYDPCHPLLKAYGAVSQNPVAPPISITGGVFHNHVAPAISNTLSAITPGIVKRNPRTSTEVGLFCLGCLVSL